MNFTYKEQIKRIMGSAIASFITALLIVPPTALYAHQSPADCTTNSLDVSIIKDKTEVFQGDTLTYTITATNESDGTQIACDITDTLVEVTLPAADGTPSGDTVTIATSQDFPAETGSTILGTAEYIVDVNEGVTDIVAEVSADGVLHDAPEDHSALIVKTIGTSVVAEEDEETSSDDSNGGDSGDDSESGQSQTSSLPALPNTGIL